MTWQQELVEESSLRESPTNLGYPMYNFLVANGIFFLWNMVKHSEPPMFVLRVASPQLQKPVKTNAWFTWFTNPIPLILNTPSQNPG